MPTPGVLLLLARTQRSSMEGANSSRTLDLGRERQSKADADSFLQRTHPYRNGSLLWRDLVSSIAYHMCLRCLFVLGSPED